MGAALSGTGGRSAATEPGLEPRSIRAALRSSDYPKAPSALLYNRGAQRPLAWGWEAVRRWEAMGPEQRRRHAYIAPGVLKRALRSREAWEAALPAGSRPPGCDRVTKVRPWGRLGLLCAWAALTRGRRACARPQHGRSSLLRARLDKCCMLAPRCWRTCCGC